MRESRVLGPKTGPERRAGYQTNFPPTPHWCSATAPALQDAQLVGDNQYQAQD